eukprot:TRINITY_DN14392_c0_g2_i1.p1 TRINITY_DN14392_c0_g2~~TRINITY_DN14392_c0_g2_i1.p1  ORF type:complete len:305 (-),score=50.67 TRINITY_DN14392_c0_g2_i1:115-1029(-)
MSLCKPAGALWNARIMLRSKSRLALVARPLPCDAVLVVRRGRSRSAIATLGVAAAAAVAVASVASKFDALVSVRVPPRQALSRGDRFRTDGHVLALRDQEASSSLNSRRLLTSSRSPQRSCCFCSSNDVALGALQESQQDLKPWEDTSGPLFVCGEDREHRPTLVARPCAHVIPDDKEESARAARKCIDVVRHCLAEMPDGQNQTMVIFDLAGSGFRNLDLTFSRVLVQGLVEEFPGQVSKIVIINIHWATSAAWAAVRGLLHPETRERLVFCGKDFQGTLLKYIDHDHPYLRHIVEGKPLRER